MAFPWPDCWSGQHGFFSPSSSLDSKGSPLLIGLILCLLNARPTIGFSRTFRIPYNPAKMSHFLKRPILGAHIRSRVNASYSDFLILVMHARCWALRLFAPCFLAPSIRADPPALCSGTKAFINASQRALTEQLTHRVNIKHNFNNIFKNFF